MALPFTRKQPARLAGILAKLEPWYDWGTINTVNLNARTDAEQVEGDVYCFEIQWLGLHLGIQIGRTPKQEG